MPALRRTQSTLESQIEICFYQHIASHNQSVRNFGNSAFMNVKCLVLSILRVQSSLNMWLPFKGSSALTREKKCTMEFHSWGMRWSRKFFTE